MTETKTKNRKTDKCLFLIAEKGKWGIQEHLKPLKPVYNGAGWFIEEIYREAVGKISQQANMRFIDWPLSDVTFEELRQKNRREYIHEKAIKLRLLIDGLKATLKIDGIDTQNLIQGELKANLEKIPDGKHLIESIEEFEHLQQQIKYAEDEEKISKIKPDILPITKITDRIKSHNETLKKYRGKKHLGLCVKTISEFNDKMLGLRKLILLAAAPNVGKTALTIQLAKEVLLTESDACLVYVSLEMDAEEIFTRMMLYHSGLNFDTYVLGSQQVEGEQEYHNFFSPDELRKIDVAIKEMEKIGDRLQIIDMSSCAGLNAEMIIEYVNKLKIQTNCKRAIVVIDYLQVWPTPPSTRFSSDIEADKWRIGEIKKIRDALNAVNQDPVIVISEARKPSGKEDIWGGDLSDVMGSARGTYTPDAVLLLNPLQEKQLKKYFENNGVPTDIKGYEFEEDKDNNIKGFLANHGIAICNLKMPKARDGMKRFNILLAYHFNKNKFDTVDWQYILGLVMAENNESKNPQATSNNNGDFHTENETDDDQPYKRNRSFLKGKK